MTLEMVQVIHRNAQRLIALFDDLLHLARIDAREELMAIELLNLANVIREAFDKTAPVQKKKTLPWRVC